VQIVKWIALTLDYQFIADPGDNADRGPVSVVSLRLHVEVLGGGSGLDPAGPAPASGRSEARPP